MVRLARRIVTVQKGGRIVIDVPELPPGSQAEVIVRPSPARKKVSRSLVSFIGSCKGMFKTAEEIDKFIREERDAWER